MTNVISNQHDWDALLSIAERYFLGLHQADTQMLQEIFHPEAHLQAPGVRRTLEQWLTLVATREVPATTTKTLNYQILALDINGNQAWLKLDCPLFEHRYIDFLGLLKENQRWLIVNKMYAERPA